MQRFKNILVGVGLAPADERVAGQLVSSELAPPTIEAIDRAVWLAKSNSARVTFFAALEISRTAQQVLQESEGGSPTVLEQAQQEAQEILQKLVDQANAAGATAEMKVQFGSSWLEIIRQVLKERHDLVVAGTRQLGPVQRLLVGSTGAKLLRLCPCPVWITKPQIEKQIKSILVAHCLRPVGDQAMELGCSLAQLYGAQLHVLHSLDFPEFDTILPARISMEKMAQFRTNANRHIQSQLEKYEFPQAPQVHIVTDEPAFAALKHIDKHSVELLVMGTIARTGVAGFFTGNTAERLLPQIPCSVLAVKPHDFVSPVVL